MHKPFKKITPEIEKKIVNMATKNPRSLWIILLNMVVIRVLAGYISNKELNLVDF